MDSIKLAAWQIGDLSRLEELTSELEPLWRERGDLWYMQWTLLEGGFVPIARARWDEAAQRLADAAAINRRIQDRLAEMLILDALCWLHRSHGEYEEALTAGGQAVALCADVGWEGWAAATLGSTLLDLGAAAPAAEVLARGLAAGERIGASNEIVRCLGQLAWAHLLLGDRDQAEVLAARAGQLLERVTAPAGAVFLFGPAPTRASGGCCSRPERPSAAKRSCFPCGMPQAARAGGRPSRPASCYSGSAPRRAATPTAPDPPSREPPRSPTSTRDPAPGWEAHLALARLVEEVPPRAPDRGRDDRRPNPRGHQCGAAGQSAGAGDLVAALGSAHTTS